MRASRPALRRYVIPFVGGLLHAAAMLCAFPPVGLWPLAFVAVLPLVWVVIGESAGEPPHVAGRSWHPKRWWGALRMPVSVSLGVLPLWAYEEVWVMNVSSAGYWPMIAILAAFSGLFVWMLRRATMRWPRTPLALLVPVMWAGVELFRGSVAFTGYPWMLLAHPLIEAPVLARPAALLGTYLVSFLVAALAGALADWVLGRPRPAAIGAGAAAVVWGIAATVAPIGGSGPGPFRIAVVQTNIAQDNKMEWKPEQRLADFARFAELTRQAAAASPRPALIVWPETMFPGLALDPAMAEHLERRAAEGRVGAEYRPMVPLYRELLRLQQEVGIAMLVGAVGLEDNPSPRGPDVLEYNSVFLIDGGRVRPTRYDKQWLTPFGESMPYIELWPWLKQKLLDLGAHGMEFNLTPGKESRVFAITTPAGPVVIGTPICFEATMARINRGLARASPDTPRALVNMTNDGWFGAFDTGRRQHLQSARWRCVELGIPMVRAANTGISAAIDGRGGVLKSGVEGHQGESRVDGVLLADIQPARPSTVYARVGDMFAWLNLACAAALVVASFVRRRAASAGAPG